MTVQRVDVCILGGGMAGLTLARQLLLRRQQTGKPMLQIAVIEHRHFPVPEATHKVGESTVEIAAHYLAQTLQLQEHLSTHQLPKFGLRLFVRGGSPVADDLADYDEIGVSRVLPVPTYQIDRGRLENHLAAECRDAGVQLLSGTTVRKLELNPGAHRIRVRDDSSERTLQAGYLVDGSGRRAWLRGQQGLSRPARHTNHAVWYRIEGALDLDTWSGRSEWRARCQGTPRRLSTNHFTGPGYWVWLIPLASDTTSVGVVFDPRYVPLEQINTHQRLLTWLAAEHPLLASRLSDRAPLDFHVLKDYAAGCKQVFSADGWMLTGDAGVFADPFYSPGADFIAFANSFITELICGGLDADHYRKFQTYYMAFFNNTLSLYRGQYGGFGDRDMMVLKTIWDYAYYWGPLAKLFFTGRFADHGFMQRMEPQLLRGAALNAGMQRQFRNLAALGRRRGGEGRFFDHHELPYFHQQKNELLQGYTDRAECQLTDSVSRLEALASELNGLRDEVERGGPMPSLQQLAQRPVFC